MLPRLAIFLAASCGGGLEIDLPLESDTKSAIVSFLNEDQSTEVHAIDLPDTNIMRGYDGRSRLEITALLYPVSSCEQMIRPGVLKSFEGGEVLPPTVHVATTIVDGGGADEWRTATAFPSPLAGFLREVSPEICLACECVFVEPGTCSCDAGVSPMPGDPAPPTGPASPEAAWIPPALGPPGECAIDSVRWYGANDCTRVGSPCPTDGWPEAVPPGPRLHVDPTAPPGGDGSILAPFDRIDVAVAVAVPGSVILLSRGDHPIGVVALDQVSVVGACAQETVVRGNDDASGIEIEDASIGNLRLERARIQVRREGDAELHDVVIDGAPLWGFYLSHGARATASRVVVRRAAIAVEIHDRSSFSVTDLVIETSTHGVGVHSGSHLVLRRAVIAGGGAVELNGATTATLTDVVISGSARDGIIIESAAELEGQRIAVVGTGRACLIAGIDAVVRLFDVELSDCGSDGVLMYQPGTDVELTRARIQRSVRAVSAPEPGHLMLEDLTVSGSDGLYLDRTDATVRRASIETGGGPAVLSANSTITMEDITARRGRIEVGGGHLTIDRLRSEEGAPNGLYFTTGTVTLRDVTITQAEGDGDFASSAILDIATVEIERMHIERSATGLYAGTVNGRIDDLTVEDSEGAALVVFAGELDVTRARLERNGNGILVKDDAMVKFVELSVVGVGGEEDPVALDSRGSSSAINFLLKDSSGYGARIVGTAELDLESGEISGNAVGCGYPTVYDLDRLMRNVRFEDNGQHLSPL